MKWIYAVLFPKIHNQSLNRPLMPLLREGEAVFTVSYIISDQNSRERRGGGAY